MFEDEAKADAILEKIANLGLVAAASGSAQSGRMPEGWSKLGAMLRELAEASPSICDQLARAWEAIDLPAEVKRGGHLPRTAAGQAFLAADYARHEEELGQQARRYGYGLRRGASSWLADCKAMCEMSQDYDDEGGTVESFSVIFVDDSKSGPDGRDAMARQALGRLATECLNGRYECAWSAQEIYEQAHASWGLGSWGDTGPMARAAEVAQSLYEERAISRVAGKPKNTGKAGARI